MIPEEYVTFETARLLKKAGFPQDCKTFYDSDGVWIAAPYSFPSDCAAPTQAQAMRWLREEKEISVESGVTMLGDWVSNVWLFSPPYYPIHSNLKLRYQTYEAAAEAGIQAACKYLLEKGGAK